MNLLHHNDNCKLECAWPYGCTHTHTQGVVVGLLKKHKIDVFGILETKMEELDELNQLMQQKFAGWYWVHFD